MSTPQPSIDNDRLRKAMQAMIIQRLSERPDLLQQDSDDPRVRNARAVLQDEMPFGTDGEHTEKQLLAIATKAYAYIDWYEERANSKVDTK